MPEITDLVIVLRFEKPTDAELVTIRARIKTLLANNPKLKLEDFQFLRRIQDSESL